MHIHINIHIYIYIYIDLSISEYIYIYIYSYSYLNIYIQNYIAYAYGTHKKAGSMRIQPSRFRFESAEPAHRTELVEPELPCNRTGAVLEIKACMH